MKQNPDYTWHLMLIFTALLLAIFFWQIYSVEGQGELLSIKPHCGSLELSAHEDVDYVLIWYEAAANLYWNGAPRRFRFPAGTELLFAIHVTDSPTESFISYTVPAADCEPGPVETGVECLGIPWEGSGIFVVDGQEYPYDQNLSFVVPLDAIWTWELFIDNQKVLRFAQTEPGNCGVIS